MKTNIKMRVTPEQSKAVQEICFKNNTIWNGELANNLNFLERPYLFILKHLETADITYDFESDELEEIDADLFIRTNGACEEPIGSKFQPSDEVIESVAKVNGWDKLETSHYTMNMLLDKLKKKDDILKKARIKRKNQREELHKLNLKLQKSISLEAHNIATQKLRDTIVSLRDDIINKVDNMRDTKNKEIENLKAVIEYLESKVK